jgi:hypothetical protein
MLSYRLESIDPANPCISSEVSFKCLVFYWGGQEASGLEAPLCCVV